MLGIELLQVALGIRSELSRTPSDKEWDAIYQFAEEHAIEGVMLAGIERLPKHQLPSMEMLMDWLGQAEYIKAQNEEANRDCERVTKLFRDAGFKTSIMKGQGNARLYKVRDERLEVRGERLGVRDERLEVRDERLGVRDERLGVRDERLEVRDERLEVRDEGLEVRDERLEVRDLSLLRTPGDIDIWVDGGFDKVNAFVQKLCPTKEINELEIQLRGVCDTPVEVHYRPFIMRNPWTNRRLQKFFAEEAESCFGNGLFTTIRFNLVHQLAHVRLHLFTEGIGIKQLVDYYFLLLHNTEDKHELMSIIDHLGMKRFAEAMMWVMKEVFLLSEDKLLCGIDAKGGGLLMQDVMKGGNFGRSDDALKERKQSRAYGIWALLVRNLRYSRFDRWDWICGPLWRIYHRIWRKVKGYR